MRFEKREIELLDELIRSDGWKVYEGFIAGKIDKLNNLEHLSDITPDKITTAVKVNLTKISICREIIGEIKAVVESAKKRAALENQNKGIKNG